MKKPKRSAGFDEKPDPMSDLDIDLEGQDDEIIDLEDIIEMPARSIDEDEDLDLGAEILDADADLDLEPEEPLMAKRGKPPLLGKPPVAPPPRDDEEDLLASLEEEPEEEEDLFKSITAREVPKQPARKHEPEPEAFDDEDLFEPEVVKEVAAPTPAKKVEEDDLAVFDDSDQSLLDDLISDATAAEAKLLRDEEVDLADTGVTPPEDVAEKVPPVVPEPAIPEEIPLPEPEAPKEVAPPGPVAAVPPPPSPAEAEQVVEELIARMEERLLENIRATVESRLPDVVRAILREELEKLKGEAE